MSNEAALDIVSQWREAGHKIYMTSGGFDPLHIGHLRCIQGTARLAEENNGKVLVLVNGDQFLIDKKGLPRYRFGFNKTRSHMNERVQELLNES